MSVLQKRLAGATTDAGFDQLGTGGDLAGGGDAVGHFAKVVVLATFVLIFLGGLVTSHDAGMAVPDWPLSFGSLNPNGWWEAWHVRLEHGHRLFAMMVGLLTGILCAWLWDSWRSLLISIMASVGFRQLSAMVGAPPAVVMHMAIWPAAAFFLLSLFWHARGRQLTQSRAVRTLALVAFVCVCFQATLGGLRVTRETAGAFDTALALRIAHGIFAQTFLCVNVALAVLLSRAWRRAVVSDRSASKFTSLLAWITFASVYVQLVVGAVMRHLKAGLAIPTFPQAAADGSWIPATHSALIDINFTHTRVGAVFVTFLVITVAIRALREQRLERWVAGFAATAIVLVITQVVLGICVIWYTKPQPLTTFHVLNGAAILAVTLVLALGTSRVISPATAARASHFLPS